MKTMTDFIMEQEVSSSTNDEVDVVKGYMEMTAIAAVAECYCEHAAIAGFATETGITVFSESDDNIFKKAWNTTKQFFEKIWEWLKAITRAVINIFTKSKIDKVIAKLEQRNPDEKLEVSSKYLAVDFVLDFIDTLSSIIADLNEGKTSSAVEAKLKELADNLENFNKTAKETNKKDDWGTVDDTVGGVLAYLKKLNGKGIPSTGSKLLKKLDFDKKKVKKDNGDIDKDAVSKIKKVANGIARAYDKYSAASVKLVSKVLNENISVEKRENLQGSANSMKATSKARNDAEEAFANPYSKPKNTGESYSEDTSGYYFL